jgi:hypothetical protein
MGFDFTSVVAAIAALTVALGPPSSNVRGLPMTSAQARPAVRAAAIQLHGRQEDAMRAYAGAPYARPDLRMFYAVAFVASRTSPGACAALESEIALNGQPPLVTALAPLSAAKWLILRLRAARVPAAAAARALRRGALEGCA